MYHLPQQYPRPIASNLKFSDAFYKLVTEDLGVPIIYWKNIDELVLLENCDVFVDEVGNYFDSRLWSDLSLDARMWLQQGGKTGVEMYGSAQDFAQVDKSFRRLVNHLYVITKVMGSRRPSSTKPPVGRIWGLCVMRELDPKGYDEDKKKFASEFSLPQFYTIRRSTCEIFDTTQKILRSELSPFKHIPRHCATCSFSKIIHA